MKVLDQFYDVISLFLDNKFKENSRCQKKKNMLKIYWDCGSNLSITRYC